MSTEIRQRAAANAIGQKETEVLSGVQPPSESETMEGYGKDTKAPEKADGKKEKEKEFLYGKTPSGQVFPVPQTHDMVSTLFNPYLHKSAFEIITLVTLSVQVALFFILPRTSKRIFFTTIFLCWRAGYNAGLGYLLNVQSRRRALVRWAKKYRLFERSSPWYSWLDRELSMKMGDDYNFEAAPIEFNTWLLYRQLVDLILMNDFVTYICFALAWLNPSPYASFWGANILRWVGGLTLVLFNIWVKLDAHRVVRDFAWYWGDFFFLIEQSLTFDGVFEMAPHPMYSVGYAGYYGISLMSASYTVLFVSLLAHAAQFAFLHFIESPHIEKTYNPPVIPRRQLASSSPFSSSQNTASSSPIISPQPLSTPELSDPLLQTPLVLTRDIHRSYFRRDLIVFKNFDLLRSNDLFLVLIIAHAALVPLILPHISLRTFSIAQALFWRLFHSYGLGLVLYFQSIKRAYTKHYIKYGDTPSEAFKNWKAIYNLSCCMTYVSFVVSAWEFYTLPVDWETGITLLRHVLGALFILLHIWTSASIYDSLGDFGWFYGDFFIPDYPTTLQYTGIYRFLNNPEKIMGMGAFWGFTLIANSWSVFGLALFSQLSTLLVLQFVEGPHMRRVYGDKIRGEGGVTKTIRTGVRDAAVFVPERVRAEVGKIMEVEKVVKETMGRVERITEEVSELVEAARPRLEEMARETRDLLASTRSKIILAPVAGPEVVQNLELDKYAIEIIVPAPASVSTDKPASDHLTIPYGQPLRVRWRAAAYHSPHDWIGLYKCSHNRRKDVTDISSRGRWIGVCEEDAAFGNQYGPAEGFLVEREEIGPEGGIVVFSGKKLPWECGIWELRYHHDGKYDVLATSRPFEIIAPSGSNLTHSLLQLTQTCMDSDPTIIPHTPEEDFIFINETYARRIVYGIKMTWGVDFAWEVVDVDGCVERLAERIRLARRAITPFAAHTDPSKKETNINKAALEQ